MDDFIGSIPSFSIIQPHMLYVQLSTIHFLAAERLTEFSKAFLQNVLQRRKADYQKLQPSLKAFQ